MAKGLRSKVKKRNRAVMRATIGKDFQKRNIAIASAQLAAKVSMNAASSNSLQPGSSLLAIGTLINGTNAVSTEDVNQESSMVEDDDDSPKIGEAETQSKEKGVGMNTIPRRVGTKVSKRMRKFGVKPVLYSGKSQSSKSNTGRKMGRRGRRLPGS